MTMTNNTPDYNDNLYFEKKMTDCKNCPYTDEYCASGDCERNADVSKTLTEKWKKGELPEGIYYCNTGNTVEILFTWGKNYHQLSNIKDEVYIPEMDDCEEIIARVPSYDELQNMNEAVNQAIAANIKLVDDNKRLKHDVGNLGYKIKNQRHEIDNRLKEIEKLKDLLKECFEYIDWTDGTGSPINQQKLLDKIDEVIK